MLYNCFKVKISLIFINNEIYTSYLVNRISYKLLTTLVIYLVS